MSSIDETSAILNHYFAQLARAAGYNWSEHNQQDIERVCDLLSDAEPTLDEIPPYRPAPPALTSAVTQYSSARRMLIRTSAAGRRSATPRRNRSRRPPDRESAMRCYVHRRRP
jgi:hypothetical protein